MLEELLNQRKALLDNPSLPLAMLRQQDRRLVLWCEQYPETLAAQAWAALSEDWSKTLQLELATRLSVTSVVEELLVEGTAQTARWQLSAQFTEAELPGEFPDHAEGQIWVAMAMARRGRVSSLPAEWQAWLKIQEYGSQTEQGLRALLDALWQIRRDGWREWFYPMMLNLPEALHPGMINWLAGNADSKALVEAMGMSGAERFKPWLQELAAQGDNHSELAGEALQQSASEREQMQARIRHWLLRWRLLEGSPWSLFGGYW